VTKPVEDVCRITGDGLSLSVRWRRASGSGEVAPAVLFLHGWPGTHLDWGRVFDLVQADQGWEGVHLLAPDLRGFGASDTPKVDGGAEQPYALYAPAAHVRDLLALLDGCGVGRVVICAYDLGANLAQTLARGLVGRVAGLLLCDPVHAAARAQAGQVNLTAELWYQTFHNLPWSDRLVADNRRTLETYLRHFYTHWWGDGEVDEQHFQKVVEVYSVPGAFEASIGWYRSRAGARAAEATAAATADRITTPTVVLWGERDPITPILFAESLDSSFADVQLERLAGVGHFAPLEAPMKVAAALRGLGERTGIRAP